MNLARRVARLETVAAPDHLSALVEVQRLMEFVFGQDWQTCMLQLTEERCLPGGDACWACQVLRWVGVRSTDPGDTSRSTRTRAAAGAQRWLNGLASRPDEPARDMPTMSPFFGIDLPAQWRAYTKHLGPELRTCGGGRAGARGEGRVRRF